MAKELHPGKRNNLNALCDRYEIDNSSRTLHGALLDTELLADVFLAMTRGQNSLMIEPDDAVTPVQLDANGQTRVRKPLIVRQATPQELGEHDRILAAIDKESKGACVWLPKE
jgi:DNA polymerase-3 subunit epsilon